jgi:uncharacterized protein YcfJ
MNKSLLMGLVIGVVVAAGAGAVAMGGFAKVFGRSTYAQVLKVTPLSRTIETPRQDCHEVPVTRQKPASDSHQLLGTIAGAVVGGIVGHQVGGGSGRDIATVAGAAAGGYGGNRVEKHIQDKQTVTTMEQQCQTVMDKSEKPAGYSVRYQLGDREGTVKMDHDPGERIPVKDGHLVLDNDDSAHQKAGA